VARGGLTNFGWTAFLFPGFEIKDTEIKDFDT
jgi:hypothetical protein